MEPLDPSAIRLPLGVLDRLSNAAFVELVSELVAGGEGRQAALALRHRGEAELIWSVLKEADLPARNLSHWGAAQREEMAELAESSARLFLGRDPQAADDPEMWSAKAALGVESADFLEAFIHAMGLEAFERVATSPKSGPLGASRCNALHLAFDILPESFQSACMRADWERERGLLPASPASGAVGGLFALCDPPTNCSDRPLRRALAFLRSQGVSLAEELSKAEKMRRFSMRPVSCLQQAILSSRMDCVQALIEAAPSLSALEALRAIPGLQTAAGEDPRAEALTARLLAQVEQVEFEMGLVRAPSRQGPSAL